MLSLLLLKNLKDCPKLLKLFEKLFLFVLNLKKNCMNKNNILWWIGLIIAILTAITTYCSCTIQRDVDSYGTTRIHTVDTTYINHNGIFKFNPFK